MKLIALSFLNLTGKKSNKYEKTTIFLNGNRLRKKCKEKKRNSKNLCYTDWSYG